MVFPGQGSQAVGMLRAYAGLPGVDEVRRRAGEALGAYFLQLLDVGPQEALNLTVNTQPAMVTAGFAAFSAWRELGGPAPELVAGHRHAVARAMELCKAKGARRALSLPVSAPFHSSLMRPAAERLRGYLADVAVAVPACQLINNVDVRVETQPEEIKDALVRQAAAPVRWVETIRKMRSLGVTHVMECGPGKVLAGLAKRIDDSLPAVALVDEASLAAALTQ